MFLEFIELPAIFSANALKANVPLALPTSTEVYGIQKIFV